MQFAFLRFPDDFTHLTYLVFRFFRFFLSEIKIKVTFAYQTICSVTEWSRSTTSLEWLIWLISGDSSLPVTILLTLLQTFDPISWHYPLIRANMRSLLELVTSKKGPNSWLLMIWFYYWVPTVIKISYTKFGRLQIIWIIL